MTKIKENFLLLLIILSFFLNALFTLVRERKVLNLIEGLIE